MSDAIITFPGGAAVIQPKSRYEQGQTHYWRNRARSAGVTKGTCPTCIGIGFIRHKYAHVDDFHDCPECTPVSTRTDYPEAGDDVVNIEF